MERRRREEAEHRHRIAEQKRYEEQQRRKLDDYRWRRMVEFAHQWRAAEIARGFLAALNVPETDLGHEVDGRPLGEWLAWAAQRVRAANPMYRRPEKIFSDIAQVKPWTYN